MARRLGLPNVIFMDIEGCEMEVLHDVQPLLRRDAARPAIYFELHQAFYGQAGLDWLRRLFEQSGYDCSRIGNHWWEQTYTARDYYVARAEDGRLCWIFRELSSGQWFAHGLFA